MNFKEWRHWVGSLPWSRRWFVFLILIRPIADWFYYLKYVSPITSPPYLIGVLTPVLITFILFFKKSKHLKFTSTDKFFLIWGFLVSLNSFFLFFNESTLEVFGSVLRVLTPVYIYFYLRYFIRNKEDLEKILQTGLYSAIIPAVIFLYEIIYSPINVVYSRGIERIHGGYADVFNYAMYILTTILILGYFVLAPNKKVFLSKEKLKIFIIMAVCVFGVIKIAHGATYSAFFLILASFFYYFFKRKKIRGMILAVAIVMVILFSFRGIYKERISPLIEREMRVLEQGRLDALFHGRARRWISRVGIFKELPIMIQLFGPPLSGNKEIEILWKGSPHNDYLRILFFSGILGLIFYLLILISIFLRNSNSPPPEKYLLNGALLIIFIYSITAHPMIYFPLLYAIFSIFSYNCLIRPSLTRFTFSRTY